MSENSLTTRASPRLDQRKHISTDGGSLSVENVNNVDASPYCSFNRTSKIANPPPSGSVVNERIPSFCQRIETDTVSSLARDDGDCGMLNEIPSYGKMLFKRPRRTVFVVQPRVGLIGAGEFFLDGIPLKSLFGCQRNVCQERHGR